MSNFKKIICIAFGIAISIAWQVSAASPNYFILGSTSTAPYTPSTTTNYIYPLSPNWRIASSAVEGGSGGGGGVASTSPFTSGYLKISTSSGALTDFAGAGNCASSSGQAAIGLTPSGTIVCATIASSGGGGGVATTSPSTADYLPLFSSSLALTNSSLSENTSTGDLTTADNVTSKNLTAYRVTRSITGTVGDTVEIGNFTVPSGNGEIGFLIDLAFSGSGLSCNYNYFISEGYGGSSNAQEAVATPLTSQCYLVSSDAFQLVVQAPNSNQNELKMKVQRTAGTDGGTMTASIISLDEPSVFTPTSATGNESIVTVLFNGSLPATLGQTNYTLTGSYKLNNWDNTGYNVNTFFAAPETYNNGGSTPNLPFPSLILERDGVSSQSFNNYAEFNLSRYANVSNYSKTQLDIALTDGGGDIKGTNVLSLQSGGNVGIGTTVPSTTLQIAGASSTVRVGTGGINPGCIEMYDSVNSSTLEYLYFASGSIIGTSTKPAFCQ